MFVYRSLALGLLGACCLLLAIRPPLVVVSHLSGQISVVTRDGRTAPSALGPAAPTIIDVARGVTTAQLADLVRLPPGEYIVTVDDQPVLGALGPGVALAALDLRERMFVDLGIESARGVRRMLLLLH
jgi:hypothetical protein